MCRSDIAPDARVAMAGLLDAIASALAEQNGTPRDGVIIGPVDFGVPYEPLLARFDPDVKTIRAHPDYL